MEYRACASPGLLEEFQVSTDPPWDKLPVVQFDQADNLTATFLEQRGVDPHHPPVHYMPSASDLTESVVAGLGWSLLPKSHVESHPGSLVEIPGNAVRVPLFWQSWRVQTKHITLLSAAIHAAAQLPD